MTACKYWDCGWCYAPNYLKTNAINSTCVNPYKCPISPLSEPVQYETPMSDLKFTSPSGETTIKVQDTGRLGTIAPKTQLHIRKTPITEIEEVKAQIQVLQKKLDFLEELEKTKSPYEEGYKKVFGYYPVTDIGDAYWEYFQKGYEQAQKDYKVGEYQEPEKEPVSLYKRFVDEGAYGFIKNDNALKVVKEFLMDEGVIEDESGEYITFTLQKSLLEVPND